MAKSAGLLKKKKNWSRHDVLIPVIVVLYIVQIFRISLKKKKNAAIGAEVSHYSLRHPA